MEMNSKDMNDNSDQITKKPRASNDSTTENDNNNNDLSKNEEGNANANLLCAICLESGTEDNKLISHQCSQCKKDAWKICDNCNQTRLSRLCPICNGDYAPLILHLVPGDPSLDPDDKSLLLYKFGVIRQLIMKSNVAVWSSKNNLMYFSLPQEFVEDSNELNSLTVSIPVTADRLANEEFLFNNKVWDEIEKMLESDDSIGLESMRPSNKAIQWLLSFTKEEGSQIYTMMTPSEWNHQLDPNESIETLKSIKENIVIKK